jgi:hypothetical protein
VPEPVPEDPVPPLDDPELPVVLVLFEPQFPRKKLLGVRAVKPRLFAETTYVLPPRIAHSWMEALFSTVGLEPASLAGFQVWLYRSSRILLKDSIRCEFHRCVIGQNAICRSESQK